MVNTIVPLYSSRMTHRALVSPFLYLLISSCSCKLCFAFNNAPLSVQEELGCSPTLSILFGGERQNGEDNQHFFFDPLSLATDDNFARMREAELKHGRIAMAGVVCALVETGTREPDFGSFLLAGKTPPVLELVQDCTLETTIKLLLVCGILEILILVQPTHQDMPGDYGLGYFGLRDKGKNERSLVSELENGRLAMLVMLYYFIKEDVSILPVYSELAKGFLSTMMSA
jgi:hypothetical protein